MGGSGTASTAGATGTAASSVSGLTASFNKLVQDLGGGASSSATAGNAASTASTAASGATASLQSFLTNFLQKLESGSQQTLQTVGGNVNANV